MKKIVIVDGGPRKDFGRLAFGSTRRSTPSPTDTPKATARPSQRL